MEIYIVKAFSTLRDDISTVRTASIISYHRTKNGADTKVKEILGHERLHYDEDGNPLWLWEKPHVICEKVEE
jgi:hypothetical protein